MKVAKFFFAVLLALVMTRSTQAASPQLRLPFCDGEWYVYPGSPFHVSYEIDFNKYGNSSSADCGSRVVAPGSGTVTDSHFNSVCGNEVKIDHGSGYTSEFCHLQDVYVTEGNQLLQGGDVGTVGDTGSGADTCHLHFAERYNGTIIVANFVETGPLNGASPGVYNFGGGLSLVSQNYCDGAPPPGGSGTPPPPKFTRAYSIGQGTANPEAWIEGYQTVGGFAEVGLPTEASHWGNGYVMADNVRPDTGIHSLMVHDETNHAPRAYAIVDTFYTTAFIGYGGLAALGPPIGNKYNVAPGVDHQDFGNAKITHDSSGFHLLMHYANGFTPGQGSGNPAAFQAAYTAAGGYFFGDPTSSIFINNGDEIQEYRGRDGKIVRIILVPGNVRAYTVKGPIYDAWMVSGHVFGGWGVPISDEYYIAPNETMVWYRYGSVYKNASNVVVFTPNPSSSPKKYAPGEGMNPDRAVHMIEAYYRAGGPGKLGACTAFYEISGFDYQYCSGGGYSGRAAIVLNYAAGNYVAIVIRGSIESYWESTGGISGSMGVPYTEEVPSPMNSAQELEDFGHKYMLWYNYAPHLMAYPYGIAVGDGASSWSAFGITRRYDAGRSGFPKNAVHWYNNQSGTAQIEDFVGGIYAGTTTYIHDTVSRAARAYMVKGGVATKYWALGGPKSYLGIPVTDEIPSGTKVSQYFQFGVISGDTTTAVYTDRKY